MFPDLFKRITVSIAIGKMNGCFAGFPTRGKQNSTGNPGQIPTAGYCLRIFCRKVFYRSALLQGFYRTGPQQLPGAIHVELHAKMLLNPEDLPARPGGIVIVCVIFVIGKVQHDIG